MISACVFQEVDWANSALAVVAALSGVYVQSSGYGAVLNLKRVSLKTASAECPFEIMKWPLAFGTTTSVPANLRKACPRKDIDFSENAQVLRRAGSAG